MAKSQRWIQRSMVAIVVATSGICIAQKSASADQGDSGPNRSAPSQSSISRPVDQTEKLPKEKCLLENIDICEESQVEADIAVIKDRIARLRHEIDTMKSEISEPEMNAAAKEEEAAARYADAMKLAKAEIRESKRFILSLIMWKYQSRGTCIF